MLLDQASTMKYSQHEHEKSISDVSTGTGKKEHSRIAITRNVTVSETSPAEIRERHESANSNASGVKQEFSSGPSFAGNISRSVMTDIFQDTNGCQIEDEELEKMLLNVETRSKDNEIFLHAIVFATSERSMELLAMLRAGTSIEELVKLIESSSP